MNIRFFFSRAFDLIRFGQTIIITLSLDMDFKNNSSIDGLLQQLGAAEHNSNRASILQQIRKLCPERELDPVTSSRVVAVLIQLMESSITHHTQLQILSDIRRIQPQMGTVTASSIVRALIYIWRKPRAPFWNKKNFSPF
jgi:hypothetical protein